MAKLFQIAKGLAKEEALSYGKKRVRQTIPHVFPLLAPLPKYMWFFKPKTALHAFLLQKAYGIGEKLLTQYLEKK